MDGKQENTSPTRTKKESKKSKKKRTKESLSDERVLEKTKKKQPAAFFKSIGRKKSRKRRSKERSTETATQDAIKSESVAAQGEYLPFDADRLQVLPSKPGVLCSSSSCSGIGHQTNDSSKRNRSSSKSKRSKSSNVSTKCHLGPHAELDATNARELWSIVQANYKEHVQEMIAAIKDNNAQIVDNLTPSEIPENATVDAAGNTALMLASFYGHVDIIKQLLRSGADVNMRTGRWASNALMEASLSGKENAVDFLLQNSADVQTADRLGFNPLILASSYGHANIANLLLSQQIPINEASAETKTTALHLASQRGQICIVDYMIKDGVDVNRIDSLGNTALMLAVGRNFVEITRMLCESGTDINHSNESGTCALHIAAARNHVASGTVLIEHSANVDCQDYTKRTPLIIATIHGYSQFAELLCNTGANVDQRRKLDSSAPLHIAATFNSEETMQVLLRYNADVNLEDKNAKTPLLIACELGHIGIVQTLIEHPNINIKHQNPNGNTALHIACANGHADIALLLVQRGGWWLMGIKNKKKQIATDLNQVPRYEEILKLVQEHNEEDEEAPEDGVEDAFDNWLE